MQDTKGLMPPFHLAELLYTRAYVYPTLILVWVERRGPKPNNYTSMLWDLNCAYAFKCRLTLGLAYQLLTILQFRFPFGARVPLREFLNDGLCTKRRQKAQHSSPKTEKVFWSFRGSGSWNYLQEVIQRDFQSWSAWMGANRSKFLCSD